MIELITNRGRVNITKPSGENIGLTKPASGRDGGYYTPSVDEDGNLSWTPSKEKMEPVEAVNIKGPQGPQGADGVGIESIKQGSQSESDNGYNTLHINLTDGTQQRFVVKNGSQGPQGEKGEDGLSIASIWQVSTGEGDGAEHNIIVELTDGSVQGFTVRNGSKGEKGDTGPQGPKGDTGEKGADGAQGPAGKDGYTPIKGVDYFDGEQGPKGEQGPQGEKGADGAQGPKGDKGDTGPQGEQGLKGDKGDKGETGPQGIQGEKGDTGATGPKGDTGAQGPQGEQGPKGDTGKTAFEYAKEGGFLGTENAFSAKLATPFVTPQMFGAVADGETDDTAAVQAALDEGGLVYFPAGVYKVTKQLTTTKPCKIMMFKQYPSGFWRSSTTSGRYDYPIILRQMANGEMEWNYQDEKGWDFGARIECYPSNGENYGLLVGDGVEIDGLFMRAMNGFSGVLLKYDNKHQYGTDNLENAITYQSYPSAMRFKHIRLDCDRHNTYTTKPEVMFDFYPTGKYFYIIDDVVIGQQNEFATYGFRCVVDDNASWANSVRLTNFCFNALIDYPIYISSNTSHPLSNWIIEGLSIQTYPYNYDDTESTMEGHKSIITLKNMRDCLFVGCYVWDLYQAKYNKLFDCEKLDNVSCIGCSDEFYNGTKNLLGYGLVEEDGIETVLKDRLNEVAEDANVKTLTMSTTTLEDGSNRISLSDSHNNTVSTDIPPLNLTDDQLNDSIGNWMDDNAMPTEEVGKNKFNASSTDTIKGYISNTSSGAIAMNDGMLTTNYIPVNIDDIVRWGNAETTTSTGFNCYQIYFYDIDKNYIGYVASNGSGYKISKENAAYIRICFVMKWVTTDVTNLADSKLCITINNTDTSFEPYQIILVGGLASYLVFQSPNGTRYTLVVNDDGTIIGKPITS